MKNLSVQTHYHCLTASVDFALFITWFQLDFLLKDTLSADAVHFSESLEYVDGHMERWHRVPQECTSGNIRSTEETKLCKFAEREMFE